MQAKAIYHNMLSIMAIMAILKIFTCRRWTKATDADTKPPAALLTSLQKTMSTAKELGLNMPGNLQAIASKTASSHGVD